MRILKGKEKKKKVKSEEQRFIKREEELRASAGRKQSICRERQVN